MADLVLTSNALVNNYIASNLSIIHIVSLSSVSNIQYEILNSYLDIGLLSELSTTINVESNIESYISLLNDEILESSIFVISKSKCLLLREVKCYNCKLNSGKALVKNGPKCFRFARFKNEHIPNDCFMYKKLEDN
jgi:hypothetical protein